MRRESFVDTDRRILYVRTPKAGCTAVQHFLRKLMTGDPLIFEPRVPSGTIDGTIHDRAQIPVPPLTAFRGQKLREIVTGDGWFRFCVIRHPYDRFFSAWQNVVFLCALPGMERYLRVDGRKYVEFSDFFTAVTETEDPNTCDVHWRAQIALVYPDDIAYTRIYNLSELSTLSGDLQRHLDGLGRREREKAPALQRFNESFSIPSDGFLNAEVLAGLRHFYAADFAHFGFPEREAPSSPIRSAAEFTSPFTDALFDRHRAIAQYVRCAREGWPGMIRRLWQRKPWRYSWMPVQPK
jgi:hypothetical protein